MMIKRPFYILLLLMLVLNCGCASFFFYPSKTPVDNPALEKTSRRDVFFKTPDNITLHGWLLETPGKPLGTVVFFHGNAGNIGTHVNSVLWLVPEGYDVFIFDYRGYGLSGGKPSLEGVNVDGEAAINEALSLSRTGSGVIVFGQSLGGAVAVYAATTALNKDKIRAVIVDSAFSDYREIVRDKMAQLIITWPFQYPASLFLNNDYSPVKWIKKISPVPVLIIHGTDDRIVPFHHGRELFESALPPKEFWPAEGKGHIEAFTDKDMRKRLLQYLKDALSGGQSYPARSSTPQ